MIAGDLEHVEAQVQKTPTLEKAFAFLKGTDLGSLAEGRIEIDGARVYALVQSYESLPVEAAKFEAHKKYLDIQFVLAGEEIIGWAPLPRMVETTPYNEAKDVFNGKVPLEGMSRVQLSAGELAVLYPSDAHAPKIAVGQPGQVKKIVVKVAVET
jgi:YhcH/YjgK/YiaL family protein